MENKKTGKTPKITNKSSLHQILDAFDDIVTIQKKDFSIVEANSTARNIFGINDTSRHDRYCYEVIAGGSKPCLTCPLLKTLQDGENHTAVIRHGRLDKTFSINSSLITFDDDPEEYLIHVARDITKEAGNERNLHESDDRFAKIFASTPAPMVISDIHSGLIIDVNQRWMQMTGYTREELIGITSKELNLWEDSTQRDNLVSGLIQRGSIHDFPVNCRTKHGDIRSTLWSAEKISINGQIMLLSLINDITDRQATEKALIDSQKKFKQAFEASPDSIKITRLDDGKYIDINRGFTNLTGYSWADVRGKTSLQLSIWHNADDRNTFIERLLKNGFCENLEAKFRGKNNRIRTGLISGRILLLKNVPHIISITRDITERRRIEREITEQRNLFEVMFNAIDDGVVITDTSRKIIMANKGMEKTFGYAPKELIGNSISMLHANAARYRQNGKAKSTQHYITSYTTKNGHEFPGETLGVKLFNQQKEWIGNLGIIRDITERKKKEEEMGRLEKAIEQAHDTIIITDPDGTIQYVNPAFEKITGYSREEVIGENPRILKSGKHDDAFYQKLWDTVTSGRTFTGRIVNKRNNGDLFTEEVSISPIADTSDEIINYVAVKRDISDQLQLEEQYQQAQKMEAVGRLTGGVAHDFNNILGIIIGYAEIVLDDLDQSHTLYDPLEKILEAGEKSARIIKQLLAFSRKQSIAPKIIDLNSAVEGMLKMIYRLIGENIEVFWEPLADPLIIKMDPVQIDQILANLCINSKDAINGIGKLHLETSRVTLDSDYCDNHLGFRPGNYAKLTVSDDGCGIKKEDQNKVFEPFFTTKKLGQGTGLGLATAYGIMKQNSGFINLYSEPEIGTTITLYFPTFSEDEQTPSFETEVVPGAGRDKSLLVVEDDFSLLTMTKKMLERQGYNVLAANSPSEALAIARRHTNTIHLLLTDVVMPEMNGRMLADMIQSHQSAMQVLFMSGYTETAITQGCLLDEGIHFIQKPFTKNELLLKLDRTLNKSGSSLK